MLGPKAECQAGPPGCPASASTMISCISFHGRSRAAARDQLADETIQGLVPCSVA
jgi:hypothetical protein